MYLSLIIVVPVLYGFFLKNEHRDRIILVTVCALIFILLALRKPFSDVNVYMERYNSLKGVTFSQMFHSFSIIRTDSLGMEWGYCLICWFFANLGLHFQIFLAIESAFCIFCIYNFIDRNSVNLPLSIVLIVGFGLVDYMYVIVRQTMALGFLLLSVESIKKRNILVFLILVFIATLMHRTAILFLVVFPLSYLPITRLTVSIFSVASLLLIPLYPLVEKVVLRRLMAAFTKEGYMVGTAFEFGELIIVIVMIIVFLMVFFDQKKATDVRERTVFWAFMIALPLHAVACYVPILSRVSTLMYMPFAGVAIPNLLETNENKKLVRIFEVLIFLAALAYYAFCLKYDKRGLEVIPYRMFFMD